MRTPPEKTLRAPLFRAAWAPLWLLALALAFPAGASAQLSARASFFKNNQNHQDQDELGFALVNLTNQSARPVNMRVQVKCSRGATFSAYAETMQPGESRALSIPTLSEPRDVIVTTPSEQRRASGSFKTAETRTMLISTSRTKPGAIEEQAFYESVFWNCPELLCDPEQGRAQGWTGSGYSYTRAPAKLSSKGASACYGLDVVEAPADWRCYLVADIVFVADEVYREIEEQPSGRALLKWVQTGGWLVVYDAPDDARERLGAGMVVRAKADVHETPDEFFGSAQGTGEAQGSAILPPKPRPHGWRDFSSATWVDYRYGPSYSQAVGSSEFPVRIAEQTSYNSPVVLSLLFFVVAGPANFFFLRSKKRIKLLFVTVPAISFAFCALITAVFFLSAGLDRRASAVSLTVVDQRSGRALTAARQLFYSGIYPNGGFQWDSDVFFLPLSMEESGSYEMSRGYRLAGGQYQPLEEMHYLTVQPFETREKIDVRPAKGGGLELANGFEMDLEESLVRHDGRWYRAGFVRQGGAAELVEMPGSASPAGGLSGDNPAQAPERAWQLLGAEGNAQSLAWRLTNQFYFYPDQEPGWYPRLNAQQEPGQAVAMSGDMEAAAFSALMEGIVAGDAEMEEGAEEFLRDARAAVKLAKEIEAYSRGEADLPGDFEERLEALSDAEIEEGVRGALEQAKAKRGALKPANLYFARMSGRPETAKAGPSGVSEVDSRFFLAGVY